MYSGEDRDSSGEAQERKTRRKSIRHSKLCVVLQYVHSHVVSLGYCVQFPNCCRLPVGTVMRKITQRGNFRVEIRRPILPVQRRRFPMIGEHIQCVRKGEKAARVRHLYFLPLLLHRLPLHGRLRRTHLLPHQLHLGRHQSRELTRWFSRKNQQQHGR